MAKSAEELQAEWWDGWWEKDFSWHGLAQHFIGEDGAVVHGGLYGEMDLQAYWRRDPETGVVRDDAAMRAAGELVAGRDGRDWHIAHLPLRWQDGSPAKAEWDETTRQALMAVVKRRIDTAKGTRTDDGCDIDRPDGRAQLTGAVLNQALHSTEPGQTLHALCDWSLLPSDWRTIPIFGPGFRCVFVNFFEGADFSVATFCGPISFLDAAFFGDASFNCATFSGHTHFGRVSFYGHASFNVATFAKEANFHNASLYKYANFGRATFSGSPRFDRTIFSEGSSFADVTFRVCQGLAEA